MPGTFGLTSGTPTAVQMAADVCRIYPYALAERALVHTMSVYVDGGGSGTGNTHVKLVVYSGTTLVATSAEGTITDTQAAGWVDLAISPPVELAAGTYSLGYIADNTSARGHYHHDGADAGAWGNDTYSDGPETTFVDDSAGAAVYNVFVHADYYTYKSMGCAWALEFAAAFAVPAVISGAPVISAPTEGENLPTGDTTATASFTHPTAAQIAYEWEVDTDNPPTAGTNYQQIITGLNDSGAAVSVVLADLDANTWYLRTRAWDAYDGGNYSSWSDVVTCYVFEVLYLLAGTQVQKTVLGAANKIYVIVEGSDPLVSANATYDTAGDPMRYATTPREDVVFVKEGDTTLCATVATEQLAFRRQERVYVSGLKVRLADGLKLDRGHLLAISHARSGLSGWYPIRKITHDFKAAETTVEIGDYSLSPRTAGDLAVRTASALAQMRKEKGI